MYIFIVLYLNFNGFGKTVLKISHHHAYRHNTLGQKIKTTNKYRHSYKHTCTSMYMGPCERARFTYPILLVLLLNCLLCTWMLVIWNGTLAIKTTVQHFDNRIKLDKICNCNKFNFLLHMKKWLYLVGMSCRHVFGILYFQPNPAQNQMYWNDFDMRPTLLAMFSHENMWFFIQVMNNCICFLI